MRLISQSRERMCDFLTCTFFFCIYNCMRFFVHLICVFKLIYMRYCIMWQNLLKIVAYSSHRDILSDKCTSEYIFPLNQFLIFVNFEDWAQIKFWDVWGCLGNFKGFLRNLKLRNEDIFVTNFFTVLKSLHLLSDQTGKKMLQRACNLASFCA